MGKINIVSSKGVNVGEKEIPTTVLIPKRVNKHTIFESVNVENQNSRQGTHDTKNKSEVSGSGKKPYRQKHTGRARQGSRRNPHFRGGGVAFGPTPEKNYSIKVNKKVFKIALASVWSQIVESNNLIVLDGSFDEFGYSTKSFNNFLKSMNLLDRKILCIFSDQDKNLIGSSRNIANVRNRTPINCSIRDLLDQNFLIISERSFDTFMERLSSWK